MKLEGEGQLVRIQAFLPQLDEMVADGLVTLERVQVITYRPGKQ